MALAEGDDDNLPAGYTRKNGVPSSEHTMLTEYFDRHEDFGSEWFTVLDGRR